MRKKSVYRLDCSNLTRNDLIDYASRCQMMGKKSYLDKCLYHYDALSDLLFLDKIELKNTITVVEVPSIFDAISSNCFYMNDNIIEIDARYIKYLSKDSIYFCSSVRSINLSSCMYFEARSVVSCRSLKFVKFAPNIDYLGEHFIDTYLGSYIFGNVYDLDRNAFYHPYYDNINIKFNYVKFIPFIGYRDYTITLNDCDSIDDYYFSNLYLNNTYNRKIRFLGDKEKFERLIIKDFCFDLDVVFEQY